MAQDDIEELIEQLSDFRKRSGAMKRLVAVGDEAIDPLIEALHETKQEGAVWSILQCLADLNAEEAVEDIAPLLKDSRYKSAAHDALVSIAGQDFGSAPAPWQSWQRESRQGEVSEEDTEKEMHETGLPDDRLLELAMGPLDAQWTDAGKGRYKAEMPIKETDEQQDITIDLDRKDHEGSAIVIVYCDCGPATEDDYEAALRHNLKMPYGALAVRYAESGPRFVMFNTLLKEDMSPLELCKSAATVAERAVRVREDLKRISE